MATTPHAASAYAPEALYVKSPEETAEHVKAGVEAARATYAHAQGTTVSTYQTLTGGLGEPPGGSEYPLPTDWLNRSQILDWVGEDVPGDQERAVYALAKHQAAGGSDQSLIDILKEIRDRLLLKASEQETQEIEPVKVPTSAWLKADIVSWLADNGADLDEEALDALTKVELLELVESLTD